VKAFRRVLICLGMFFMSAAPAIAQDARPVRIVVGNAPGGITDTLSRLMAESFTRSTGRTFVVENKPGAAGNIAAEHVARSAPDGSVMLMIYNSHPTIAALYPNLTFDPVADFQSVGLIAGTPYLLVANPAVPGKNLAEALSLARAGKRTLSFASPGAGTPQHLTMERLKLSTGLPITIAHYKGTAPGQNDVLAGHVDMTLSSVALALPQVRAGKLKVLAVTSAERLPFLPNEPTVSESGVKNFVSVGWMGFVMPAKTPPAIVKRYNDELNRALASREVRDKLEIMGASPIGGPPEDLDRQIRDDKTMWTKIIHDLKIKAE
jgi:tripartite-type tricarboxylate transporter receptor subunit TctC